MGAGPKSSTCSLAQLLRPSACRATRVFDEDHWAGLNVSHLPAQRAALSSLWSPWAPFYPRAALQDFLRFFTADLKIIRSASRILQETSVGWEKHLLLAKKLKSDFTNFVWNLFFSVFEAFWQLWMNVWCKNQSFGFHVWEKKRPFQLSGTDGRSSYLFRTVFMNSSGVRFAFVVTDFCHFGDFDIKDWKENNAYSHHCKQIQTFTIKTIFELKISEKILKQKDNQLSAFLTSVIGSLCWGRDLAMGLLYLRAK